MLPELPKVRPRSKSDLPKAQIASRRARVGHGITSSALVKKSGAAEIARLQRQRQRPRADRAVHGTPGSISGPMRSAFTSSAWTTAPEVSPPATTSRRTPALDQPPGHAAIVPSTMAAATSLPSRACAALTSSGEALAETRTGPSPSRSPAQASAVADLGVAVG